MAQSVTLGNYRNFVRNAAPGVPETFLQEKSARIDLAYKFGETPEMIADEIKLLYSLRPPRPTKSPRQLAKSVMRVHDATVRMLGK